MDRASFTARLVTVGQLDDVDEHVAWASDEAQIGPHSILMRGSGDDSYSIVSGDSQTYAPCYGGISSADVQPGSTTLLLEPAAAVALELPEPILMEHGAAVIDARSIRQHCGRVLKRGGQA